MFIFINNYDNTYGMGQTLEEAHHDYENNYDEINPFEGAFYELNKAIPIEVKIVSKETIMKKK